MLLTLFIKLLNHIFCDRYSCSCQKRCSITDKITNTLSPRCTHHPHICANRAQYVMEQIRQILFLQRTCQQPNRLSSLNIRWMLQITSINTLLHQHTVMALHRDKITVEADIGHLVGRDLDIVLLLVIRVVDMVAGFVSSVLSSPLLWLTAKSPESYPFLSARAPTPRKNSHSDSVDAAQHYCDVCKISCVGKQSYEAHLTGQKHRKKVQQQSVSASSKLF